MSMSFHRNGEFDSVQFPPVPSQLKLIIENFILTAAKDEKQLFRVNTEDSVTLFALKSIVEGILRGNLSNNELKDIDTMLNSVIRGNKLGS